MRMTGMVCLADLGENQRHGQVPARTRNSAGRAVLVRRLRMARPPQPRRHRRPRSRDSRRDRNRTTSGGAVAGRDARLRPHLRASHRQGHQRRHLRGGQEPLRRTRHRGTYRHCWVLRYRVAGAQRRACAGAGRRLSPASIGEGRDRQPPGRGQRDAAALSDRRPRRAGTAAARLRPDQPHVAAAHC